PADFRSQDWGWGYQVLPYLEQGSLHAQPTDAVVRATPVKVYFCPSRRGPTVFDVPIVVGGAPLGPRAQIDYAGNQGTVSDGRNGLLARMGQPPVTVLQVTDGTSNTLLVGERWLAPAWYGQPGGPESDDYRGGYTSGYVSYGGTTRWGTVDPRRDGPYPASNAEDPQR